MVEAERVEQNLSALIGRIGPLFARPEPLRQAGKYVRGLLSDLPRKNCWTLAEHAGDRTPDRMQRLLERASWDTFAAMSGSNYGRSALRRTLAVFAVRSIS